jgi:anti-sigma regulatory factor (Ser/Thr protein kinase)
MILKITLIMLIILCPGFAWGLDCQRAYNENYFLFKPEQERFNFRSGLEYQLATDRRWTDVVVEEVSGAFAAELEKGNLTPSQKEIKIYQMKFATTEVFQNALKHANRLDPNRAVSIQFRIEGENFILEVKDESGRFYDPANSEDVCNQCRFVEAEDIAIKIDEIRERRAALGHDPTRENGEGGMGVLLIHNYTDAITYKPATSDGKVIGTHVTAVWVLTKVKELE